MPGLVRTATMELATSAEDMVGVVYGGVSSGQSLLLTDEPVSFHSQRRQVGQLPFYPGVE